MSTRVSNTQQVLSGGTGTGLPESGSSFQYKTSRSLTASGVPPKKGRGEGISGGELDGRGAYVCR